jgi:N-ethylmaleimide reductase
MIDGDADMVSFGRLYISNPDLGYRILNNKKINDKWNMATFYTPGPEGYVDYKTYEE